MCDYRSCKNPCKVSLISVQPHLEHNLDLDAESGCCNHQSLLLLTRKEIEKLIGIRDVIDTVEEAFREKGEGKVQMPPKQYLYFHEYLGDLRVMPAYLPEMKIAGVKIVNSHPRNFEKKLPSVMAVIELVEPETGRPIALLDGTLITAMRTGAASAVATKYLSKENARSLCIIGAGTQSYWQLDAINQVRPLETLSIYDIRQENAEKLATYARTKYKNLKVVIYNKISECVKKSEIIVTVTPSRKPLVSLEWVTKGTHINAIGADAPGKQELDPNILLNSKIIVDDIEQTLHSGEINVPISRGLLKPEDIYAELGEIVAGKKPGREKEDEITVFDSTGLAILDVAVGKLAVSKAKEKNLGFNVVGLGI